MMLRQTKILLQRHPFKEPDFALGIDQCIEAARLRDQRRPGPDYKEVTFL